MAVTVRGSPCNVNIAFIGLNLFSYAHRRNFRGGGGRVPPLFGVEGTVPPSIVAPSTLDLSPKIATPHFLEQSYAPGYAFDSLTSEACH